MSIDEIINDVCGQIVRNYNPNKVILFGSYAYGTPTDDSDVDLLVIMPYIGNELQKMADVRKSIRSRYPLDVLVKTPEQIKQRIEAGDFFVREIVEKGIVLYESGDLGVDR